MLDVLTVFVIAPLILIVLVGVMLSVYNVKNDTSAKLWIAGCLSLSVGYVFAAMRSSNPAELSYILPFFFSNVGTLLGVLLTFMAFELLIDGKKYSIAWITVLSVLCGVALTLLLRTPMKIYIGLIVGLLFGVVHLYFAYRFIVLSTVPNIYMRVLIIVTLIHGGLWIFRSISGLFGGYYLISTQAMTNIIFVLIFVMLSTARQFLYVLLRLSSTSQERKMLVALNEEKNKLISSLLKVNKTVATGALSATVAHEVNQPLGAIKLTLNLLRIKLDKGTVNNVELKNEMLWLEGEVDRAAATVNNLKAVFQESEVSSERLNLVDLTEFVINLSSLDLKKRKISVVKHYDENCWVSVNEGEIRQVLINVLGNAADALVATDRPDRQIVVTVKKHRAEVILIIADNGLGINPAYQSQIFELLHTNKAHGTGVGLWLSRALMTRHNGTIDYSPTEGGGATFTIKLPAV